MLHSTLQKVWQKSVINVNWKIFTWDHVIFGFHKTMVTKSVSDLPGMEGYNASDYHGSDAYHTLGWVYSDSWYDRLWPVRKVTSAHPQWYNKVMKRFNFKLGRKCS